MSPEALFFTWLIAIPDSVDPSVAAQAKLDEIRSLTTPSPNEVRLAELLRQVTPFAAEGRRRRCEARKRR